jgi:hypothetical protein
MRNIKQKVMMFRNSMLGFIFTLWIHGGSGHSVLRPNFRRKHLQRYFTQIIRLNSRINNKTLDFLAVHVTREGGKWINALSNMLGFLYFHRLRIYFCVLSFYLIIYVLIRYLHFAHFPCS